jgi:hypothetical protein
MQRGRCSQACETECDVAHKKATDFISSADASSSGGRSLDSRVCEKQDMIYAFVLWPTSAINSDGLAPASTIRNSTRG